MATNIVVTGLPGEIKFTKLLNKFRAFFKRMNIKMFWIRNTTEVDGFLQATIELVSMADARKARNFMNSQSFRWEMNEYRMEVHLENEGGHFGNEGYESRPRPAKRNRPRSRSPGYRQEASKLDMEIELLRKQRQVIEEERRLLVEQKKLEMIREYGPSASREFDHFDDYEPPRKKRQPEPVSKPRPRPRSPLITNAPKNHPKGLPVFFQPCKKLISQMKPHIEKGTTPDEVGILIKLIRAAIRKELAITLEGKAFIPTPDIVKQYRERHPIEEDEAFVGKILANIRASYLTTDTKDEKEGRLKVIKKEKVSEIEPDDAKGNENETNNTKVTDNETSDNKATENKTSDNKATENETSDNKATQNKTSDNKATENETSDNKATQNKTSDNKATENETSNNKATENDKNVTKDTENDAKGDKVDEVADRVIAPKDTANGENETGAPAPDSGVVKTEPNTSEELENNSAENLTEPVKIKTNDDAVLDETAAEVALEGGAAKDDDWLEDWNKEETKAQ